jgi:hypothetical protein
VLGGGPASSGCARGLGRRPWQGADDGPRGRARRRYDEVNAARVPRRSARRGAGGSRLETVVRSCTDAEETRWPARSAQRSLAGRTRRRAGGALERDRSGFQPVNASLSAFFSKKLNRSAKSGEYESCRSNYPLQLSQRSSNVFLNRFYRNVVPTWNAALFWKTGGTVSRLSFSLIPTQNLKCQSTRKLCPSTRWTTLIKVDFEVFR